MFLNICVFLIVASIVTLIGIEIDSYFKYKKFKNEMKAGDIYTIYMDSRHYFTKWERYEVMGIKGDTFIYRKYEPMFDGRQCDTDIITIEGNHFKGIMNMEDVRCGMFESSIKQFWYDNINGKKYEKER